MRRPPLRRPPLRRPPLRQPPLDTLPSDTLLSNNLFRCTLLWDTFLRTTSSMTDNLEHLAKLPGELLLAVAERCPSTQDLASFALASRRYAEWVIPALYKRNIREENASALLWAVLKENTKTMDLLKQHGADINSLEASTHLDQSSPYRWIRRLCLWDSYARDNESYLTDDPVQDMLRRRTLAMSSSIALSSLAPPLPASQPDALPPPPAAAFSLSALQSLASRPARLRRTRRAGGGFGFAPLALAARKGLTTAAKWLLENGADLEVTARDLCGCDNGPIMSADMWRVPHQAVGPAMEQPHWTALHLAIQYGHDDIVELLLNYGANIHQVCRSADGPCSALHTAFIHGRESIVYSLMIRLEETDMVDINVPGRSGTPLHIAYCLNSPSLVGLALAYGAYVNIEYEIDQNKWTLFSMACAKKDWAFALRLLKLGANPYFDLERKFGGRWTSDGIRGNIELQLAFEFNMDALALKIELDGLMRDRELAYL